MNAPKKSAYSILILLTLSTLVSCSRVKIAYNYADWLLSRQAHQYLRLGPEADQMLSDEIKAYHAWHRKEMLPVYSVLARKVAAGFRGTENAVENVRLVTPMFSGIWADTMEPMIHPVARALWSLDEKGIQFLEKAYAADSERQRKLYLADPAAANARRVEKSLSYVRDFCSSLSPEQEKKISELTLAVHFPYEAWVADRERRKRDLIALLKSRPSELLVEAALRDWWLRSRVSGATVQAGQMDIQEVKQYFLGVIEALTPEQRENAAARLEEYAARFDELALTVPGPQPRPTAALAPKGPLK